MAQRLVMVLKLSKKRFVKKKRRIILLFRNVDLSFQTGNVRRKLTIPTKRMLMHPLPDNYLGYRSQLH